MHRVLRRNPRYRIVLFFLWLPSADLAVTRVANRVCQGGHCVPEQDIRRRFAAGIRNLIELYWLLVDAWWLYDASLLPPRLIATCDGGKVRVQVKDVYRRIVPTTKE